MDFLVAAELNPQNQWQIELMIESFNALNAQDKLLVCLCSDVADNFIPDMTKNISKHSNTMLIRNFGQLRGYSELNKLYAIRAAIEQKRIGKKFFVLNPDMILCHMPTVESDDNASCHFQVDPTFVPELIDQNTDLQSYFNIKANSISSNQWASADTPICFCNFPIEFFEELIFDAEKYIYNQFYKNEKIWNRSIQTLFNIALYKYMGNFSAYAKYEFKCTLHSKVINNFIHYEHGYQPIFHKNMFKFTPPYYFSLGNPFKTLAEYSPTPTFQLISKLAQMYLRK